MGRVEIDGGALDHCRSAVKPRWQGEQFVNTSASGRNNPRPPSGSAPILASYLAPDASASSKSPARPVRAGQ